MSNYLQSFNQEGRQQLSSPFPDDHGHLNNMNITPSHSQFNPRLSSTMGDINANLNTNSPNSNSPINLEAFLALGLEPASQQVILNNAATYDAYPPGMSSMFGIPRRKHPQELQTQQQPPQATMDMQDMRDDTAFMVTAFNRFDFAPLDPQNFIDELHVRYELLSLIRYAEMGERFDDMALLCRHLVQVARGRISREERVYFILAHNHLFAKQKYAAEHASQPFLSQYTEHLRLYYKQVLLHEYKTSLLQTINFCQHHLLRPSLELPDQQIHILKFVADMLARLAELNPLEGTYASDCITCYHTTARLAEKHLSITSPIRLGLLLNFAIAVYKLYRDVDMALNIAKSVFGVAIKIIDKLDDEDYSDSVLILQLLKDNIALWSNPDSQPALLCAMPLGLDHARLQQGLVPKQRPYVAPQSPKKDEQGNETEIVIPPILTPQPFTSATANL